MFCRNAINGSGVNHTGGSWYSKELFMKIHHYTVFRYSRSLLRIKTDFKEQKSGLRALNIVSEMENEIKI